MEVLFHIFCYTGLKKMFRYTKDVVVSYTDTNDLK